MTVISNLLRGSSLLLYTYSKVVFEARPAVTPGFYTKLFSKLFSKLLRVRSTDLAQAGFPGTPLTHPAPSPPPPTRGFQHTTHSRVGRRPGAFSIPLSVEPGVLNSPGAHISILERGL